MKTHIEKGLNIKMTENQRNFDKWIAAKHPENLYSFARYLAATALDDLLQYSDMKPSKQQAAILRDFKAGADLSLEGFGMTTPCLDCLKKIAAGDYSCMMK
jgi:hypothetical protein